MLYINITNKRQKKTRQLSIILHIRLDKHSKSVFQLALGKTNGLTVFKTAPPPKESNSILKLSMAQMYICDCDVVPALTLIAKLII